MSAIISLFVIIASVYALAIITEEFFVVSLDKVAARLEMPSDVAGASLMAMGSSAPELFIALIAVFLGGAHGEVGIGTIVGSAVFNILVITGASAMIAKELVVRTESVQRDVAFYLMSITLLLIVFWDGIILPWEALLLAAAYIIYLAVLWWGSSQTYEEEQSQTSPKKVFQKEETPKGILQNFNYLLIRIFGFVARDPEEDYVWAMLVSVAAIALLSYALVESTVILSAAIGLPPVIVSLTLLAAGTSAPDLIASVSVAEEGRGSMAVANAVGSNIFDILIGLSVPWLIIMGLGQTVEVETDGLIMSIFILAGTVLLLYFFLYTGSKFKRREGSILLAAYVMYVVYVILTT